jgi:hypothetical protein
MIDSFVDQLDTDECTKVIEMLTRWEHDASCRKINSFIGSPGLKLEELFDGLAHGNQRFARDEDFQTTTGVSGDRKPARLSEPHETTCIGIPGLI